MLERYFNT